MGQVHELDEIADRLRLRICLAPPDSAVPLHETGLSKEFALSRTPIRQVLQGLKAESMIEVRPGVGTVSRALDPARRRQERAFLEALLDLARTHEARIETEKRAIAGFAALHALSRIAPLVDLAASLRLKGQAAGLVTGLFRDPVLAGALMAAMWRDLRWAVDDARQAPDGEEALRGRLLRSVTEVTRAGMSGDLGAAIGALEQACRKAPWVRSQRLQD